MVLRLWQRVQAGLGLNQKESMLILGLLSLGGVIHFGTAILRLAVFFPFPRLFDFGAFYASAWVVRSGGSPYALPVESLAAIVRQQGIPFTPPALNPTPFLPLMLQPLTVFNFPTAAWLWLAFNLGCLAITSLWLARLCEARGWWLAAIGLLTLTFGPVFLDLTLGQTSTIFLLGVLLLGRAVRAQTRPACLAGAAGLGLAAGIKLFPLLWVGALPILRRGRLFGLSLLAAGLAAIITWAALPQLSRVYASEVVPGIFSATTENISLDDQSLTAGVTRWLEPQTVHAPGITVTETDTIHWEPWLSFDRRAEKVFVLLLEAGLGLGVVWVLWKTRPAWAEGAFYLWVLFILLIVPHTERYNHTLLLPAMAWSWGQAPWLRKVVAGTYFLAGLARLTHVWVRILPAWLGPVSASFGLLAVFLLAGGMAYALLQFRRAEPVEPGPIG